MNRIFKALWSNEKIQFSYDISLCAYEVKLLRRYRDKVYTNTKWLSAEEVSSSKSLEDLILERMEEMRHEINVSLLV